MDMDILYGLMKMLAIGSLFLAPFLIIAYLCNKYGTPMTEEEYLASKKRRSESIFPDNNQIKGINPSTGFTYASGSGGVDVSGNSFGNSNNWLSNDRW
jgi:hypothetical protein